jgi:hypothetical protein
MIEVEDRLKETKEYDPLPTLKLFHESPAQIRSIVGPVGSGKTSAAAWDFCFYLPYFLLEEYGIKRTKWVIVRNTYTELIDTTQKTVFEWFGFGNYAVQQKTYILKYPDDGPEVELMFRSCDRPQDKKKFKSLEITGYWIDESIEVDEEVKRMLKNRIGRYPQRCPVRFGIETTNPPDVEHPTYSQFDWHLPPPGPIPSGKPLENHKGFWQPPYENIKNLRPGYYDDLRRDYADTPDWIDMYIEAKPGVIIRGKLVYHNFKRDYHVATDPLKWTGQTLYRGWDNSGNRPACMVVQIPAPRQAQVLSEFFSDKMGIVDFGNYVVNQCNLKWPGAEYLDWGDPAGENEYSKKEGGFTSNAKLMRNECNIKVKPSEQNLTARIESVEQQLGKIDGLLIDPSCTRLINGFMGGYCYPENKSIMGEFLPNIMKNKYKDIHDSLQYVMVKLFESKPREELLPKYDIETHETEPEDYDILGRD